MPEQQRYLPVLKLKKGECDAVRILTAVDKRRMIPLFEVVAQRPPPQKNARAPKRPKQKRDWLPGKADEIRHSWGPAFPALVEIQPGVGSVSPVAGMPDPTERLFREARKLDLQLVPVVRLAHEPAGWSAIREIVTEDGRGVCIRLTRSDWERPALKIDLQRLLTSIDTTTANTDLVLDLHTVDASGFDLLVLCARIPLLDEWRSFTVVGGAFPSGLAKCQLGKNWIPRHEWRAWIEQVHRNLPRVPGYGDYATQHPVPYNPDIHPNPSANIRYTTDRDWLVMKGQQLVAKELPPTAPKRAEQFPAMARLIEETKDENNRECYCGERFSYGDAYLHKMAEKSRNGTAHGPGNTGGTTSWLAAGVNHHLTYVMIQIDKLFGPSSSLGHGSVAASVATLPQAGHTTSPVVYR